MVVVDREVKRITKQQRQDIRQTSKENRTKRGGDRIHLSRRSPSLIMLRNSQLLATTHLVVTLVMHNRNKIK
jgi:hypothetical protein